LKKLGFTSAQIYDAEEKQEAREELHSILARESGGTLLILPGPRDHETRTAMRNGWALDRIILVDKSAAVLALHTRNFTEALCVAVPNHVTTALKPHRKKRASFPTPKSAAWSRAMKTEARSMNLP